MIKNCAINEQALAVLDPIRDELSCSYSCAIIELSQQNLKSDTDRINETFKPFRDTILGIIDGHDADKLFLEIIRIITINRAKGNYAHTDLHKVNKMLETLFGDTRNEVKEHEN